jgi:hypothetical protein
MEKHPGIATDFIKIFPILAASMNN